MSLRSLLFTADEPASQPIGEVLTELGVEGEFCSQAAAAVEKLIHESFQIVLIDWDQQPEAGLVLSAARDRKLAERPLTLAIVSNDAGVPKALQAGANSILRKPLLHNQIKDTLKTACDLLQARKDAASATASGLGAASSLPSSFAAGSEPVLRAGEFLQATSAPATQFDIDSDFQRSIGQSAEGELDALKELEPMAAAVSQSTPERTPPPPQASPQADNGPRGLEWYLKQKRGHAPAPAAAAAPAPAPEKPELLGFDQSPNPSPSSSFAPTHSAAPAPGFGATPGFSSAPSLPASAAAEENPAQVASEQAGESQLFAYMDGQEDPARSRGSGERSFGLGKRAIISAAALAACAIIAAPQAPWHGLLRSLWGQGQQSLHAWLNPQVVAPAKAPEEHENFARAGDEYKLPVAENIPDATTDPSQIRVTPVVDPTAKKTNNDPAASPAVTDPPGQDGSSATSDGQAPAVQVVENPAPASATDAAASGTGAPVATADPGGNGSIAVTPTPASASPPVSNPAPSNPAPAVNYRPPPPAAKPSPAHRASTAVASANIPSSLQSQMASMTPDASGNKPVEAALPSIEPVAVPEGAERGLLAEQPEVAYPASAKGQQGTVVLQVLIGRDGSVQDAKFLQGSLAFARAAIEGVKQWKFKPYTLNGRPVSVQTQMTLGFKPGA
jgi:periplasmic protein TonB